MNRHDAECETKAVFNDIYDRLSEAYDLLRDDSRSERYIDRCELIIKKLMNDTRGE
ncbi:MAG: hypothetical protein JRJ00_00385 [Deltaproteobacteria bacterium]|nr:hypothetical protein [Deltaproteobacteria bacterium]